MTKRVIGVSAVFLSIPLFAADKVVASDPSMVARTVQYHKEDIVPIRCQMGYTCILQFDSAEKVVNSFPGDPDHWQIENAENVVLITPHQSGAKTNLNVVTTIGNIYSFSLKEISTTPGGQADLKIFVKTSDSTMAKPGVAKPLFVSVDEAAAAKRGEDEARRELADVKSKETGMLKRSEQQIQQKVEAGIHHSYGWDRKPDIGITSIYESNGFLKIEGHFEEAPAVYAVADKADSLVQVDFVDGVYTVPRLIDRGYLRIGKKTKVNFWREKV